MKKNESRKIRKKCYFFITFCRFGTGEAGHVRRSGAWPCAPTIFNRRYRGSGSPFNLNKSGFGISLARADRMDVG